MILTAIKPRHFPYFPYDGFTFSLGLVDGDQAWLSGYSSAVFDPDSGKMKIHGDMSDQTAKSLEKIGVVLEGAGMSFSDVVHVTENVTIAGLPWYDEAARVRDQIFARATPAVTTVILDRLVRRAALIEIEVVAHRGGGREIVNAQGARIAVMAGPDIVLPTLYPIDRAGAVVAPGDYEGQLRHCVEQARTTLEQLGLSLRNVVRTVDFTTPNGGGYLASRELRRELFTAPYPAAASIVMSQLRREDILVSLDVIASRDEPVSLLAPWPGWEDEPVSPAVKVGHRVTMSALSSLGVDDERHEPESDLEHQAERAYRDILELLASVGGRPEDLVQTIEYVASEALGDYRAVADVRRQLLRPPWPASVGAVCHGFARSNALIDAVAFALLPS